MGNHNGEQAFEIAIQESMESEKKRQEQEQNGNTSFMEEKMNSSMAMSSWKLSFQFFLQGHASNLKLYLKLSARNGAKRGTRKKQNFEKKKNPT